MNNFILKLDEKPFSKREAWNFIKSHGPILNYSIRQLASLWKWHRSKVERFIKLLMNATLIETDIKTGRKVIKSFTNNQLISPESKVVNDIETVFETVENGFIKQDGFNSDSKTFENEYNQEEQKIGETINKFKSRQIEEVLNFKEEKKKRSKKRKEEIKEKTPLKGGKKEKKNLSNKGCLLVTKDIDSVLKDDLELEDKQDVLQEIMLEMPKKLPDSVVAEDVIDWAEKNLPAEVEIEWELEKFKDYYRYCRKKPPKDAVAAFRNWLRKSTENFKAQNSRTKKLGVNDYEHYGNKTKNYKLHSTSIERFLAGGIRAVNHLTGG
jgi:hypothetical protein